MRYYIIVFLIATITGGFVDSFELQIEGGPILGITDFTKELNKQYYAFQGIPYAEPANRFELSELKKPWTEVLNCTFDKSDCVQIKNKTVTGSEDCLFVNVYSRNLNGNSSVMVYIHGGGFTVGTGAYSEHAPDLLLEEGLVVVTIQYRLGIFGFMSTGDLACPGNLGLKDQVVALTWVQRNIKYFGGNPEDVTLFGESAGGASISLHLQSPKSKGLFKGAIMDSGTSLCLWSLSRKSVEIAIEVGLRFGIITTNSSVLVDKLKKIDYVSLQSASDTIGTLVMAQNPLAGSPFAPVIEKDHETAFFTGNSEDMLSKGNFTKKPVLAGFNSNEAGSLSLVTAPPTIAAMRLFFLKYDIDWGDLVPVDLTTSFFPRLFASTEIKQEFFGDSLLSIALAPEGDVMKFINVDQFVRPINKFISHVSKYVSNTFYYMLSYVGDYRKSMGLNYTGVKHAEELNFIFLKNFQFSPQDKLIRRRLVRMWANFCKFSSPTPEPDPLLENVTWLPASQPFLMNINTTMGNITNPFQKSLNFYEILYSKYGKGVYDTY